MNGHREWLLLVGTETVDESAMKQDFLVCFFFVLITVIHHLLG